MNQFVHITEAVLPDALSHDGGTIGQGEQRGHQRLHVGRETGMRHRLDFQRMQRAGAGDAQCVVVFLDRAASRAQLGSNRLQMLRDDVMQRYIALGDGGGYHVAACLDLIRNDGIVAAVHLFDAMNFDNVGTGTMHVSAHHVQEVSKVHNVRLTSYVFQNSRALCQHGSQHGVHGSTDGHRVKEHMPAHQVVGLDMNLTVLHRVLSAKGGESLQMLVDGTGAEIAAAGHSDLACTKTAQQRTQEVVAGPHLAGQLVRHFGAINVGGINFIGAAADHADTGAQLA